MPLQLPESANKQTNKQKTLVLWCRTVHVTCVRAHACEHACVCAHFCVCVHACLCVCMCAYAHLNMCTKVTRHFGQHAHIYVQLIVCKCAGSKVSSFAMQCMISYTQRLYPFRKNSGDNCSQPCISILQQSGLPTRLGYTPLLQEG